MVRKEKKISSSLLPIITILYCTSSNLVDKLQNSALLLRQTAKISPVAQTNCKTQPCCSDKLQKSARLLRQTAKLSPVAQTNCKNQPGCSDKLQNSGVAWVTSMPCHAIPPCAVHELLHFKIKASQSFYFSK